jgi:hypothetical protein
MHVVKNCNVFAQYVNHFVFLVFVQQFGDFHKREKIVQNIDDRIAEIENGIQNTDGRIHVLFSQTGDVFFKFLE